MTTNTTALITGANKGIGFETTRQLLGLGWTVWLGARDEELGEKAVAELTGLPGDVRHLPLDVTNDASVRTALEYVAPEGLDVLVNNAGITGGHQPADKTMPADFLAPYGVNVLGPVRMIGAFLPLLRASGHGRIVNVSSGMGSFALTTDPGRLESTLHGLVYSSSKAALNMLTSQYAKALPELRVNCADPGYTATDLNGNRGTQPVEVGARPVIEAATVTPDGPTGRFFGQDGFVGW